MKTQIKEKMCRACLVVKPASEFYKETRCKSDGLRGRCKACDARRQSAYSRSERGRERGRRHNRRAGRRWHLTRRYGLTPEAYRAIHDYQGGVCAICRKESKTRLVVDHCHVTGKVRGLLCFQCNSALAAFGDCLAGIRRAEEYLSRAERD